MIDLQPYLPGVTHAQLAALLERHGLGDLQSAEPLGVRSRNPLLRINGGLVLRVNLRAPDLPLISKEALIMRRLSRVEGVPVPEVLALDTARDLLPFDVLILRYIDGVSTDQVWRQLGLEQRQHISMELGRVVGAIQHDHWSLYGDLLPAHGFLESARWADVVLHRAAALADRAARMPNFPRHLLDGIIAVLNDGDALFDTASPPTLTHTDLAPGNVLLRRDGDSWSIAALIDWDRALVADAVWEFADLWHDPSDPFPWVAWFMEGYRERHEIPHDFRMRQRLYRLLRAFERALDDSVTGDGHESPSPLYLGAISRLLLPR
jgi:aminoglycoside phosphotransferase (APT) family kinase protein